MGVTRLGQFELLCLFIGCCFITVNGQCSGTAQDLTAEFNAYKTLKSTNYPASYDNGLTCLYKIDSGGNDRKVAISYIDFNLETNYDILYVYDSSTTSNLLSIDNGVIRDKFYISSGQYMYLKFTSDFSVAWSGFKIQYISVLDAINTPACGSTFTVNTAQEEQYALNTFSDPIDNTHATLCTWTIQAPASNDQFTLTVQYTDFEDFLSYGCDQTNEYGLSILDGTVLSYQVCDDLPDSAINIYGSGSQSLTLKFRAPTVNSIDRGFIITILYTGSSVPATVPVPTVPSVSSTCGSDTNPVLLTASNVTQFISSPNYPSNYANNLNCWWRISASGDGVKLSPNQISTDSADAITVFDGPSYNYVILASYSGAITMGSAVYSTGDSITIKFGTDGSDTDSGFYIGYEEGSVAIPSCAPSSYTNITAGNGTIYLDSHVGYGTVEYSNSLDTYWLISKPSQTDTLYLKFTSFRIEDSPSCIYDYVKVYSGACEVEANRFIFMCAEKDGTSFEHYYGKYVLIHFHTDETVTYNGWRIGLYTADTDTDKDDENDEKVIWPFIVLGVLIFIVIVSCILAKHNSRQARTVPTTPMPPPPVKKKNLHLSSIVIIASQFKPKPKPETKRKRFNSETSSESETEEPPSYSYSESNPIPPPKPPPSTSLAPLRIASNYPQPIPPPQSPPPTSPHNTIQNTDDNVPPPSDQGTMDNAEYTFSFDPNNIPPAFNYTMPPQLR